MTDLKARGASMRVVYSPGLIAVPVCQPHAELGAQPSCWMRATCSVDGQYFSSSSGSTLVTPARPAGRVAVDVVP
jgi:hypothetical protein